MTNEEVVRACKWCLEELKTIDRISKKMETIVHETVKSGDLDRILDIAKMQLTWTIILKKKLKKVHEIRNQLEVGVERMRREQEKREAPDLRIFYRVYNTKVKS